MVPFIESDRVEFKEERLGRSPRGHHKIEIESTDFTETFAYQKSSKLVLVIARNKEKKIVTTKICCYCEGTSPFWFLQGPDNCKFCPGTRKFLLVFTRTRY
jgi:hypothetical protein